MNIEKQELKREISKYRDLKAKLEFVDISSIFEKMRESRYYENALHNVKQSEANKYLATFGVKNEEYNDRYKEVNARDGKFTQIAYAYLSVSGLDIETEPAKLLVDLIKLAYLDKDLFFEGEYDFDELNNPGHPYYTQINEKHNYAFSQPLYAITDLDNFVYYTIDASLKQKVSEFIKNAVNSDLSLETAKLNNRPVAFNSASLGR